MFFPQQRKPRGEGNCDKVASILMDFGGRGLREARCETYSVACERRHRAAQSARYKTEYLQLKTHLNFSLFSFGFAMVLAAFYFFQFFFSRVVKVVKCISTLINLPTFQRKFNKLKKDLCSLRIRRKINRG